MDWRARQLCFRPIGFAVNAWPTAVPGPMKRIAVASHDVDMDQDSMQLNPSPSYFSHWLVGIASATLAPSSPTSHVKHAACKAHARYASAV